MKFEILDKEFNLDGKKVSFLHADGTPATNAIGIGGEDKDGNLMFFEIQKLIRPELQGKQKFCRLAIQRVLPCIEEA